MDYQDNPYYNNSNQRQIDSFGIASLVCGILASLAACCTGAFGIPIAALGLIFAMLSTRRNQFSDPITRAAWWLNGISLAVALFTTAYVIYVMLTNPSYLENVMNAYQSINEGKTYMEVMQEMQNNMTL
jgi:membrane associated rhomboid family serine protease